MTTNHQGHKLTYDQRVEIAMSDEPINVLMEKYNVSRSWVKEIKWKYIAGFLPTPGGPPAPVRYQIAHSRNTMAELVYHFKVSKRWVKLCREEHGTERRSDRKGPRLDIVIPPKPKGDHGRNGSKVEIIKLNVRRK